MGERKGQNKYYPPDYDPSKGGLNKFLGTHALRERARKLHMGILIIRFEMPYNIWCEGCGNHVGMGVRYNAEKKKVGMYYTTPIYEFKMKCHLCNNHYVIRTDPANLDYVIQSGARRQENRFQASENGTVVPDDKDTIKRLASDPMFKLDRGDEDMTKAKKAAHPRINKITQIQDRVKDDYLANRILRDKMRSTRKLAKSVSTSDQALLKKSCLPTDLKLLPENEEDVRMASLLKLVPTSDPEEKRSKIEKESIFAPGTSSSFGGKLKNLHESILYKTTSSPFSSSSSSSGSSRSLSIGVKRKNDTRPRGSNPKKSKPSGITLDDSSSSENEKATSSTSKNNPILTETAISKETENKSESVISNPIQTLPSENLEIKSSKPIQTFSLVNGYSSSSNESD